MRVEEAIGRQIAHLRARRQLSLADLGEALGRYLGKPWSRQAVHQAERGQRSFTAAELTALALVLDTAVQALFRAEDDHVELPGRAIPPEEYRGILLNRQNDAPLDGLEELIVALNDIGEILERPALARLARIARAAE
jgi:transcriptional regulator with XRE-family HTH domain